jgi:hypothetical protein
MVSLNVCTHVVLVELGEAGPFDDVYVLETIIGTTLFHDRYWIVYVCHVVESPLTPVKGIVR